METYVYQSNRDQCLEDILYIIVAKYISIFNMISCLCWYNVIDTSQCLPSE